MHPITQSIAWRSVRLLESGDLAGANVWAWMFKAAFAIFPEK